MKTSRCQTSCANHFDPAALVLACLVLALPARANTVTVTSLADHGPGSLRDAITETAANGTINFSVSGAILLTNGAMAIDRNLTITGPGATNLTVNGDSQSSVFNIYADTTAAITGLTISRGYNLGGGDAQGGGIINAGTLTMTDCVISGNTAQAGSDGDGYGGGIYNSGVLALADCKIESNMALGGDNTNDSPGNAYGGGIYSLGTLILANCLIMSNSAYGDTPLEHDAIGGQAYGGGIATDGALALTNCTVSFNYTVAGGGLGASGGGLYLGAADVGAASQLANCTVASNSVFGGDDLPATGGGIDDENPGLTLICCTISGNYCGSFPGFENISGGEGGGLFCGTNYSEEVPANPDLENTIVSGNSAQAGADSGNSSGTGPDVDGSVLSGGFNFIGQADGSAGWTNSDLTGSIAAPLDPALGPLQTNGGLTPTMALLPFSAAIDQGYRFGLTTDQRGEPRPMVWPGMSEPLGGDGSDIGAFEYGVSNPIIHFKFISFLVPLLTFNWTENSPGASSNTPLFRLQRSSGLLSFGAAAWMDLQMPARMINNQFMSMDLVMAGPAFYRLIGVATNSWFVPPPATLGATLVSSTSATLNGSDAPIGHNTTYWFEYGGTTNYGATTQPASLTTSTSTNQIPLASSLSGLGQLTTYHFQLVVMDDEATQYGGDQTFTTTAPAPTVVTLDATAVTTSSAELNGSINGNGANWAAYFQYGLTTSYGSDTYADQNFGSGYSAQNVSNTIAGLSPSTTYHYRIFGTSLAGQSYGADASFTTAAPQAPPTIVTLGATSLTHGTATLNGMVNPNGASTTVYFQWGTNTSYGSVTTQTGVGLSAESFAASLSGLSANTIYHYRFVGINIGGTSYGADTNFTTLGD